MQQNDIVIAGNVAADAKLIRNVSQGNDLLAFAVYTRRNGNSSVSDAHNVVRFGPSGSLDHLATKITKGCCVQVKGKVQNKQNKNNTNDKVKYYTMNINANASVGDIQVTKSFFHKNRIEVAGFLAEDAMVRNTKSGQVLSITLLTGGSSNTVRHNIVKFTKNVGTFTKLLARLKKGAGITTDGTFEKRVSEKGDTSYHNNVINASASLIQFTQEAKGAQESQKMQVPQGYEEQPTWVQEQAKLEQEQFNMYEQQQQAQLEQMAATHEGQGFVPAQFEEDLDQIFNNMPIHN